MEDTPMVLASAGRSEFTGVVRKGLWTSEEDLLMKKCIEKYGERHWHLVPSRAGLRRCRKSCRLRWLNYLKPNIRRGPFDEGEVDHIIKLQSLLGNRWTLIASILSGRTANDIKNIWNSRLGKQTSPDYSEGAVQNKVAASSSDVGLNPSAFTENSYPLIKQPSQCINPVGAIRGARPGGSSTFIVNPQAQIPPKPAFLGPMNEARHEKNYVQPPATYGEHDKEEHLLSWVRNILLGDEEGEGEEQQQLLQLRQQWEHQNIVSFPSRSQAGGVLELVAMPTPWSEEMQDWGQKDRVGGQY